MEKYKTIIKYPNYLVSNLGNIKNKKTGRILKYYVKPNGYKQVQLGHRNSPEYVHRLVAQTFISNNMNKKQVNHINGNKSDNRVENLEWVTASENQLAYGYEERIKHRQKKIIAINRSGEQKEFNSRNEVAKYFNCNKSCIDYGRFYKKGFKKDWKFELKI